MTTKANLLAIDMLLAVQSESMSPAVRVQVEKAIQALMDEDAQKFTPKEGLATLTINIVAVSGYTAESNFYDVTPEQYGAVIGVLHGNFPPPAPGEPA